MMKHEQDVELAMQIARESKNMQLLFEEVEKELIFSCEKYANDPMTVEDMMASWDTIHIELHELKREINRQHVLPAKLYKEALQTTTMGLKFLLYVALPLLRQHDMTIPTKPVK